MRYIRFLKTPRVAAEKKSSKNEIHCLVTVTSDLGDSFLPYDIQLSAELWTCKPCEDVVVWRTVQWTGGKRSVAITLPLPNAHASSPLRVRIGIEPKTTHDECQTLTDAESRGVVSAWSAEFGSSWDAVKLVERRFVLPKGPRMSIWEETGESIARHLWDAGITLSCQLGDMLNEDSELSMALIPSKPSTRLRVLELGTGCGMVSISLAQIVQGAKVILTDLPEAREIVERNMRQVKTAKGSSLQFQELDWNKELPSNLQSSSSILDLVLAADCTYNSDSSPALVQTLSRLAGVSPNTIVAIAMKMRHSSEEVFFELMAATGFQETKRIMYPLPGDAEVGEETVFLYVYQYDTRHRTIAA